mgnify:CR=1 FL=1
MYNLARNMSYIEKLEAFYPSIGNTEVVQFVFEYNGIKKVVYAKKEFTNPSGSIKIRPAYQILHDAISEGKLVEGQCVIEVTSGNMGIALAYLCKKIENPITILMPKTMSKERIEILENLGADVVLTEDFLDAFNKQNEFISGGAYCTKQFENPSNLKAHVKTANEIIDQVDEFDGFVSGVGTGGTLIGVGSVLKQKKNTKVIVIDPKESGLIAFGQSKGKHKIQGLSDQVIPALYNKDLIDEYIEIASDDAICMARKVREIFGISVGISSGANLLGAVLSKENVVVTVLPDDDKKYLSTDLYNESITSKLVDDIKFLSAK